MDRFVFSNENRRYLKQLTPKEVEVYIINYMISSENRVLRSTINYIRVYF